jgi:hypothetical protein
MKNDHYFKELTKLTKGIYAKILGFYKTVLVNLTELLFYI